MNILENIGLAALLGVTLSAFVGGVGLGSIGNSTRWKLAMNLGCGLLFGAEILTSSLYQADIVPMGAAISLGYAAGISGSLFFGFGFRRLYRAAARGELRA